MSKQETELEFLKRHKALDQQDFENNQQDVDDRIAALEAEIADAEKPSVVEIPIDPPSHSLPCLSFRKGDNIRPLYAAPEYPDFIGFKYEDSGVSPCSRMYELNGTDTQITLYPFMGDYEVLTPTHVLFKENTNG